MMDAKKFLIESRRICALNSCTEECPLKNTPCCVDEFWGDKDIDTVLEVVEKWSKENPFKMVTTDIHFDKLDIVALQTTYRYLNTHYDLKCDNSTDRKHMSYVLAILKHILDLTE